MNKRLHRNALGFTILDQLAELRQEEATLEDIEATCTRILDRMAPPQAAPLRVLLQETIALHRQYIEEEYRRVYKG